MRNVTCAAATLALIVAATPAAAGLIVLGSNIDLSSGPFTFGVTSTDTFTLTYDPQGAFDPSPILVRTTGTAATTSFGGFLGIPLAPSVFFTDPPVEIGPSTFPGFNSFPIDTRADFTATPSDLGLRYSIGPDDFFGYARFAGPDLISVAFESTPDASIIAGATPVPLPEPATWTLFAGAFFLWAGFSWGRDMTRSRAERFKA
jgi:hypothetical protein